MTCRRFSALALAAGFVFSQAGCFGFLDRNSSTSSNVCGSSCGSRLHGGGGGIFSRWFGSSSHSSDAPMMASSAGMPMGGGDCPCSSGGLYQPVGLSGMQNMQSFPGVPAGVPVTVGEAQPLPIQPIPAAPGAPGTMLPPGQAPRIQPVPMAPGGVAPSAGVAPQQSWHP